MCRMADLVVCGIDQRYSCKKDESNAYWQFWRAAYSKFASLARGHVQIIVEPKSDIHFLINNVVLNLQDDKVTSVTVYGMDRTCDSVGVSKLVSSLEDAGFQGVSCDDVIANIFRTGSTSKKEDTSVMSSNKVAANAAASSCSENESTEDEIKKRRLNPFPALIWLFLLSLIALVLYHLYRNGYIPPEWLQDTPIGSLTTKLGYERIHNARGEVQNVCTPDERLPLHSLNDNAEKEKGEN